MDGKAVIQCRQYITAFPVYKLYITWTEVYYVVRKEMKISKNEIQSASLDEH